MKKVLIGILIGVLVIVGGCVAFTGFAAKSVSDSISEVQQETANKDAEYQKLCESIQWEVKDDGFTKTIEGVLENTTSEYIDYIQFDYKTFDGQGVTVDKSFTNETDIAPGEKRSIVMYPINDFETFEITVSSSAL